jgi:hypothetical protein
MNEMEAEERADFEAHFFDCTVCADDVRQGAVFVDAAKQILREQPVNERTRDAGRKWNMNWLRWTSLVPTLAAACLTIIVVYQNTVTLPALRTPQVLSTEAIAPLAREAATPVTIDPNRPLFGLNFVVDSPQVYARYNCEFQDQKGRRILMIDSGPRDVSSFTLSFLLPAANFPDGSYVLTVRPVSGQDTVIQRYTFAIRRGRSNENTTRE